MVIVMSRRAAWIGVVAVVVAAGIPAGAADEGRLADYFGFLPLEVYKLDKRLNNLQVRDLDGDKTDDVIVVNNGRSRIDLLLSKKKDGGDDVPAFLKTEVNDVPSDRRMRLANVPVNKEVVSLATGDFNGDGKFDIAFYGTPAEFDRLAQSGRRPIRRRSGQGQHRRGHRKRDRAHRRRLQPRRQRRPRAVVLGRVDPRLSRQEGQRSARPSECRTPPRTLGFSARSTSTATAATTWSSWTAATTTRCASGSRPKADSLDPSSGLRRKRHGRWRSERSTTARARKY